MTLIQSASRIKRLLATVLQNSVGYELWAPRPYFVVVEATHRCNAGCTYCDSWKTPTAERARELSLQEHVRLLREAHALGVRMVSYTGGEPLLRPDLVEIARAATALRMRVLVNTNGYLVTPKNARELLSVFDSVTVSIDSLDPTVQAERRGEERSLELALRGLDLLVEARRRRGQVRVNVVVDERNAAGIDCLAAYLRERRVPMLLQPLHRETLFPIVPVSEVRKIDSHADALGNFERFAGRISGLSRMETRYMRPFYAGMVDYLKGKVPWFRCYAGSFSFQIGAYGDVMVCQTMRQSLGNLREKPLKDIWASMTDRRREVSSNERKCSCWLLCTTLNFLHADRLDRLLEGSSVAGILRRASSARSKCGPARGDAR